MADLGVIAMSRCSLGWSQGDPMVAVGSRDTAMETSKYPNLLGIGTLRFFKNPQTVQSTGCISTDAPDSQKIVKKGSKYGPPGPKNGNFFLALFDNFRSFLDLKIFLVNEFF